VTWGFRKLRVYRCLARAYEALATTPKQRGEEEQLFKAYLLSRMSAKSTRDTLRYARQFAHVLDSGDASKLLQLSPDKRLHVMKALVALSKYQGRYDQFLQIRQRYSLKWAREGNSIQAFNRFFNPELTFDTMVQTVKRMIEKLPHLMGQIVKFAVLVGLRPAEVVEAVRLINDNQTFPKYYDPEQMTLQHYKFPQQFLRSTKKAYLSFATPEIIDIVKLLPPSSSGNNNNIANDATTTPIISYNKIMVACRKVGVACDMRFCRKIFASWLRMSGIQPEVVDMLQGRVSQSVLTRHYLVPQSSLKDQVLDALKQLQQKLAYYDAQW
jgi:hypothetical protein